MGVSRSRGVFLALPLAVGVAAVLGGVAYRQRSGAGTSVPAPGQSVVDPSASPPRATAPGVPVSGTPPSGRQTVDYSDDRLLHVQDLERRLLKHLERFGDELELAEECARLVLGTSEFTRGPDFRATFEGGEDRVRGWAFSRMRALRTEDEKILKTLSEATLSFLSKGLASGGLDSRLGLEAVRTLRELTGSSPAAQDRLAALIEAHLDQPRLSAVIGGAPSGISAQHLTPALERALWAAFEASRPAETRSAAATALASHLRALPDLRDKLLGRFWDHDEFVRSAIVSGLRNGDPGDRGLVEFFTLILRTDSSSAIRGSAMEFLTDVRGSADPSTLQLVRASLSNQSPLLRRRATMFLAQKGDPQDLPSLESLAQADPDPGVRRSAQDAVAQLKSPRK
jgi:hypothetical protein